MAAMLAARRKAGESYDDLVHEYHLTPTQIEQAVAEYATS
jgi:uncharacterized protein (DUF433 family)